LFNNPAGYRTSRASLNYPGLSQNFGFWETLTLSFFFENYYSIAMDFTEILKPGIRGESSAVVDDANTASFWGSGELPVYSTPCLVALLEGACLYAVSKLLPEGWSTVGTEVNISHLAPSPRGRTVRAFGELLEVDRRRLVFKVEVYDEIDGKRNQLIARGTHGRFIINREKFLAKAESPPAPGS
jgi:predicted thioesterase